MTSLMNILMIVLLASSARAENSLLIKSIVVIDGTGSAPSGPVDVEVIGNKISRIGEHLKSKATHTIDGRGKTLVPGLMDCHTHIRTVPGAIFRNENEIEIREQQKIQLQAYLAAGVTTILDAATPLALFDEVKGISKSVAIPRFKGLSPFLTPKDGYFSNEAARRSFYQDLTLPIEKLSEIHDRIHEAVKYQPLGIKTSVEFGFSPFTSLEIFDQSYRFKIKEEAAQAGLPVFVHSEEEKAFWLALDFKPYAFMHGGFFDKPASAEIVQKIHESGAFVVSTLAIYKMMVLMWDQEIFDEIWFKMLVPPQQIKTAREKTADVVKLLALQNRPWFVPKFLASHLAHIFINQESVTQNYLNSRVSLKAMYDKGVPIVAGSDSGNYPVFSTFFHGVGSILEIEALEDAGIPTVEVIRAATSRAARMLKIDNEVGTIEPGKIADMIILKQDPLKVRKAFRDIAFVVKDGDAKSPREWLATTFK